MTQLATELAAKAAAPERSTAAPTVKDLIERQKAQIARALPQNMDPERFTRIVLTEVKRTPKLATCEPATLLGAMMLSAQLGLEPGPLGHAYLLPFKNNKTGRLEVQFIVGYKGYIDLARRSGNIESIVAREVREADHFDYEYGLHEKLVHKPALTGRGKAYAYYGIAKYRDGGHTILVMSREDVDERRARSKAKDNGPWVTDYDAMARKTVIRAMSAFLPLSIEAQRAVAADEAPVRFSEDADDFIDVDSYEDTKEGAGDDGPASGGDASATGDGSGSQDAGRTEPEPAPADAATAASPGEGADASTDAPSTGTRRSR